MTLASPRRRTWPRVLLTVVLAFSVLVGAGVDFALVNAVQSTNRLLQPQIQVARYLDAVVAGDVKAAIKLGRINPAGGEAVLDGTAYRSVPNRVTSYDITKTVKRGSVALVTASIRQGDHDYVDTFSLHNVPALWGMVPEWDLDEQELPSIDIAIDAPSGTVAKIAGITLNPGDGYEYVLPGDYTVAMVGTPYFSAPQQTVTIGGFGSAGTHHDHSNVTLTAVLTKQGVQGATTAVARYLADCVGQDSPQPVNCPFELDPDAGASYADSVWRLDSPTVSAFTPWNAADPYSNGFSGWPVHTVVPGMVDYSGTETAGPEPGGIYTDPFAFGIGGVITSIDSSGTATFVFTGSDYNADSGDTGTDS